jgi:hypothetical protein
LPALGSVLLRFGGFNGEELGDSIEVFDPSTNSWTSRPFNFGPAKRSVSIFVPHPLHPDTKAIVLFGEKSPSSGGHNAAGKFWSDIWVYDYPDDQWEQIEFENPHILTEGGLGWSSGVTDLMDQAKRVLIWGGLDQLNERIGLGWSIQFMI